MVNGENIMIRGSTWMLRGRLEYEAYMLLLCRLEGPWRTFIAVRT